MLIAHCCDIEIFGKSVRLYTLAALITLIRRLLEKCFFRTLCCGIKNVGKVFTSSHFTHDFNLKAVGKCSFSRALLWYADL